MEQIELRLLSDQQIKEQILGKGGRKDRNILKYSRSALGPLIKITARILNLCLTLNGEKK